MILPLVGYALLALCLLGLTFWAVGAFNDLVRLRARVHREFSGIEVSLRQRHEEVPRLVEVCRGYVKHEVGVLKSLTALRRRCYATADINTRVLAENQLQAALVALPAVFEAYPDLKASRQFLRLQERLSQLETTIADRREIYNQAATHYNTAIDQFPLLIFARLFRFVPSELFELADPAEAEAPGVELAAPAK